MEKKHSMNTLTNLNLEFRDDHRKESSKWLWPSDDIIAWKYLNKKTNWFLPDRVTKFCKKRDIVIQAGGNAGIYPKQYSSLFKTTITVEPDYRNFFCLTYNVPENNVFKFQACLGNSSMFLNLDYNRDYNESNRGGMKVSGNGIIPQITIDSLNTEPDLIHLDIEGYEGFALEGAKNTLTKYSPIIVLETNGSGDQYGWPQTKIDNLLCTYGYTVIEKWGSDTVYGK